RSSGKLQFLMIRDGSGIVQGVASKNEVDEASWQAGESLTQEAAVRVRGTVRADARAPGGVEISVQAIEALSPSVDYPIGPKEHGPEFLLDNRHLWLRSRRPFATLRVRDQFILSAREWLHEQGFVCVDAPIFTPNACEGTTTLFETEYFGQPAYLTQSGQLYMEAAAMAFGKVYCFGPTFRAEKSKTRRHLTEFWMIEPEVAYLDLEGNMDLIERFVSGVVERVLDRCREELKVLERDTTPLEKVVPPFPRIAYRDAVAKLRAKGHAFEEGGDFGSPDETALSEDYDRPILVHRFPAAVKAFYMKGDPADPTASLSVDLLAPEGYGEIVGGGQREDDLAVLERKIEEHGLPRTPFEWYLDLRRYGTVPHSGFGIGVERTVAWICGLAHLREAIPFPRMIHRLTP
ncbi:MAG TPA: asparagine--tRNA ligase, partial [Candidatus Eisenbacteria bacterium]|nr:asparagine--tRNA ligase [Candidatus Eisenbacteria bacterium]